MTMPISKKQSVSLDIHALIDASSSLDDGVKAYWHERVKTLSDDQLRTLVGIFVHEQEQYRMIIDERNRKVQAAYTRYLETLDRETNRSIKKLYARAEALTRNEDEGQIAALWDQG